MQHVFNIYCLALITSQRSTYSLISMDINTKVVTLTSSSWCGSLGQQNLHIFHIQLMNFDIVVEV